MILKKHPLQLAIGLFVSLLILWLLSSGHYTALIISFGIFSCALVVFLAWKMEIIDSEGVPIHLLGRGLIYFPWLIWQIILSNIDVTKRVLSPKVDVSPRLIEVKTSQKTDLGRVIYANSITLTPGTVSIMVHDDRILVHAIAEEVAIDLDKGEMDRRVTRMEGLS
ncbi:Na+/H+ antiporter subunit E [Candidatus Zixiibacteriota bacterium]